MLLELFSSSCQDTRAIIDAIHSGDLAKASYENFPRLGRQLPRLRERR